MKYVKIILLINILLFPIFIKADTCDNSGFSVDSIVMEEKSNNVNELEEAEISENGINLHLNMNTLGNKIKYKIGITNNSDEDYELNKDSLNIKSNYIDYSLEFIDNSNIIKANSSKDILLNIEYKNEVPVSSLQDGIYSDNNDLVIDLKSNNKNVIDKLINPKTGVPSYIFIITIILIISGIVFILFNNKKAGLMSIILGIIIIIPSTVNALCKLELKVKSSVEIGNVVDLKGIRYKGNLLSFDYIKNSFFDNVEDNGFIINGGKIKVSATSDNSANVKLLFLMKSIDNNYIFDLDVQTTFAIESDTDTVSGGLKIVVGECTNNPKTLTFSGNKPYDNDSITIDGIQLSKFITKNKTLDKAKENLINHLKTFYSDYYNQQAESINQYEFDSDENEELQVLNLYVNYVNRIISSTVQDTICPAFLEYLLSGDVQEYMEAINNSINDLPSFID